jgi:hypothetical protein
MKINMIKSEIMNQIKQYIIVSIIICSALLNGCATGTPSCIDFVPPKVQFTGEKTVVERQIIGDYRELEKDAWVVSSVQSSMVPAGRSVRGDRVLFSAMQVREFHKPKIRKYKDESAIGEGNTGLIYYRRTSKYEKSQELKKILMVVLQEENKARAIIFKRSIVLSGKTKPSESEIKTFAEQFSREQQALAIKNDWIQNSKGVWVRKK